MQNTQEHSINSVSGTALSDPEHSLCLDAPRGASEIPCPLDALSRRPLLPPADGYFDLGSKPSSALPAEALEDKAVSPLPVMYLPGDVTPVRESAMNLMRALGETGLVFNKNQEVVALQNDGDGPFVLRQVSAKHLPSFSQKFFRFHRKDWRDHGGSVIELPRQFTHANATAILSCQESVNLLPKISKTTSFATINQDGAVLSGGYHPDLELLVTSRVKIPEMATEEAVRLLLDLLVDWQWSSPADQSRAIAAILAPMLRLGVFIDRSLVMPIFMVEADESQSGKGLLVKLIGAIYDEPVSMMNKRNGGVGSFDECFNKALLEGRPLISLDNLRGRINSSTLESFVTADGKFSVRALRTEGAVDSRAFVIYGTSNAFETTQDLANRLCAIRIRHQPDGYKWREWPEGGILEHVKANHPQYLGAVAAVLRSWILDGMPSLDCAHPQREWAGGMNWIVQRIFGLPPLTEGHNPLLQRMRNPVLGFLRELAIKIQGHEQSLTLVEMISEARANGVELPSETPTSSPKAEQLYLGGAIKRLFGSGDTLEVDGHTIERTLVRERRPDGEGFFDSKAYRFSKTGEWTAATAATAVTAVTAVATEAGSQSAICTPCGVGS